MGNNPVKYSDPTGHKWCVSEGNNGDCNGGSGTGVKHSQHYKLTFTGTWTNTHKKQAMEAVEEVGGALANAMLASGGYWEISSEEAFNSVYGNMEFEWDPNCFECRDADTIARCGNTFTGDCAAGGGYTLSGYHIKFASLSGDSSGQTYRGVKNVVHELGHAYDNRLNRKPRLSMPASIYNNRSNILRANDPAGRLDWQQNEDRNSTETFADMFIAWIYDAWNLNPDNARDVAKAQAWMDKVMP